MYDQKKGQIIFKNQDERESWISKCEKTVMKEYYHKGRFFYEKWKKDGERFLNEEFLKSSSFPYLNDGRPELIEWIEGTLLTGFFSLNWDYDDKSVEAREFLTSMSQTFALYGTRSQFFVATLNMILGQLNTVKEYYDCEEIIDQNTYDETAYEYYETENEHNEEG